jgi:hypothetical protein
VTALNIGTAYPRSPLHHSRFIPAVLPLPSRYRPVSLPFLSLLREIFSGMLLRSERDGSNALHLNTCQAVSDALAAFGVTMPRIDPTAQEALYRMQREEQQQAREWLVHARMQRKRKWESGPHTAERLEEAKRLIEAIGKLL